jgi:hypothetical protein
MVVKMILLFGFSCGGSLTPSQTVSSPDIEMYHGLEEGATWTYRDDGLVWTDTGFELDEELLLRASYLGEGLIEFRRGARWADGTPYGSLELTTTDGLALSAWDLPIGQGAGEYPFSNATVEVDGTVSGDWSCKTSDPEEGIDTYYALFENVYVFSCSGGGPEGEYVFAMNTGLVKVSIGENYTLELVAPW